VTEDQKSSNLTTSEYIRRTGQIAGGSLADQVHAHLRRAIILGELQPGLRLAQVDIATQMGTSQAPVREALQRLERDGLIERNPRSGHFVTGLSADEMHELFCIRSSVECLAIRRTVKNITPAQCDQLDQLIEQMRQAAGQDDMMLLVENDLAFHRQICEWSGNKTLLKVWIPLYAQIQRFVVQTHRQYFEDLVEIANTHNPVVEVLRKDDPDEAARVIDEHIMLIWEKIGSECP